MEYEREALLERRHETAAANELWDQLSLAQKCASSSLTQSGYELAFIRRSRAGNLAILLRDQNSVTIGDDGVINTAPCINIRP